MYTTRAIRTLTRILFSGSAADHESQLADFLSKSRHILGFDHLDQLPQVSVFLCQLSCVVSSESQPPQATGPIVSPPPPGRPAYASSLHIPRTVAVNDMESLICLCRSASCPSVFLGTIPPHPTGYPRLLTRFARHTSLQYIHTYTHTHTPAHTDTWRTRGGETADTRDVLDGGGHSGI